jgi:hypothetical protein
MTKTDRYVALRLMQDRIDNTVEELVFAKRMEENYRGSTDAYWRLRGLRMECRYQRQTKALLRIATAEIRS